MYIKYIFLAFAKKRNSKDECIKNLQVFEGKNKILQKKILKFMYNKNFGLVHASLLGQYKSCIKNC